MATLELRDVEKIYPGGHHAVRGVTERVGDGEFVAIVGPSGCGKTSVLRMIAGLEEISAGQILIDDERVNDDSPQQRDIAMAFQQHALYPHLTAEQNMGFSLRCAGVHRREIAGRVFDLAVRLGLDDVLDQRPSKLSGGQQQRVAMARAIIRDPRLFLMDEPLSNLDAKLRTEARSTISSIHRRLRSTTVYVTHDQLEAMSMADRVLVMRAGRIVQRGAPIEVYRDPVDLFVGAFLGSSPMSVVVGRIEPSTNDRVLLRLGSHVQPVEMAAMPYVRDLVTGGGADVLVGIRPEAIRLDPNGPLELSVESFESLGREWVVRLVVDSPAVRVGESGVGHDVADHPFSTVSLLTPLDAAPSLWVPMRVSIDPVGVHLFDPASGRALAREHLVSSR